LIGDDNVWIELLEQGLRCTQLLPDGQAGRFPRACPFRVVAREHLVRRAVRFADRAALRRARDEAVVTERFVELLTREWQERREHHFESVDAAKRDIEDGPGPLAIGRDELPRLGLGQVLIDERGEVK